MQRRLQQLNDALGNVQAVSALPDQTVKKTYGALCHRLPILVRQDGLPQTLAFIEDKATVAPGRDPNARQQAYRTLREHLAQTLASVTAEGQLDPAGLLTAVRGASTTQLMLDTYLILEAWVFYKRFAVSILGVEPGQDEEEA